MFGKDSGELLYRIQLLKPVFKKLCEDKKNKYSKNKFIFKCVSNKYKCNNLSICEVINKYEGLLEGLFLNKLMLMSDIDIDHRISLVTFSKKEREKELDTFLNSIGFYEIIPNSQHTKQIKLIYYNSIKQKNMQTIINPDVKNKTYDFVELLNIPDGILIGYSKNK